MCTIQLIPFRQIIFVFTITIIDSRQVSQWLTRSDKLALYAILCMCASGRNFRPVATSTDHIVDIILYIILFLHFLTICFRYLSIWLAEYIFSLHSPLSSTIIFEWIMPKEKRYMYYWHTHLVLIRILTGHGDNKENDHSWFHTWFHSILFGTISSQKNV